MTPPIGAEKDAPTPTAQAANLGFGGHRRSAPPSGRNLDTMSSVWPWPEGSGHPGYPRGPDIKEGR